MNWAQMYDCYGDVDRVPELLARVEREDDDAEAWDELGYRLILECDLVFPASFTALPRLVHLGRVSEVAGGWVSRLACNSPGGNHAMSVPLSTVCLWIIRGQEKHGKRGTG
ncbi:hypothetical protein [Streptomyces sp. NPDC054771]